MFFRGRGTTYLAERDDNGVIGPAIAICQDALSIAVATESGEHINKCGPVDAPDDRYVKSSTGTVTLSYSDVADKLFAIGVLGTVKPAENAPVPVTGEVLPDNLAAGDVYFLGGLERNRGITSLTFEDSDSPPNALTSGTHYDHDPASGRVTFKGDLSSFTQPFVTDYSHQNPKFVSLLSAAQKQYVLFFEGINLRANNAKTDLELYNVRFDPAQNVDFLSEDLQVMELQGSMLSDASKDTDSEFGQFGRRVG